MLDVMNRGSSSTVMDKRSAKQALKTLIAAGVADLAYLHLEPASASVLMMHAILQSEPSLLEALVKAGHSVAVPPPDGSPLAPLSLKPFELCMEHGAPPGFALRRAHGEHHGAAQRARPPERARRVGRRRVGGAGERAVPLRVLAVRVRGDPSSSKRATWVDDSVPPDEQHRLAVMLATDCSSRDAEADAMVQLLIQAQLDVNTKCLTERLWTPLHYAAHAGAVEVIDALIAVGETLQVRPRENFG
jgi:hypothetical protein